MLNILSVLFGLTSATVAGLAFADFLLRDSDKKWINNRATDFWNWLDDQSEPKYLRYLRGFRWLKFVAMLYAFVALLIAVGLGILVSMGAFNEAEVQAKIPRNFEYFILGGYIAGFLTALVMVRVLPSVFKWVTKTEGSWAYIGRSTVAAVATIALYYAADAVVSLSMSNPTIDPSNLEESLRQAFSFSHPITAAVFGAYGMVVVTVVLVVLMSWALVVIPVILVLLLMLLFSIGEFFALRVAENPKGPQYVLSFLLAAASVATSSLHISWT